MNTNNEEFLKRLLSTFRIEAQEHLNVISSGLTEMGKVDSAKQAEIVETVYREAHSLKGAARSVNLIAIVSVCQAMENVFSALKRGKIVLSTRISDLLHQTVDFCFGLADGREPVASEKSVIRKLIQQLDGAITGEASLEAEKCSQVEPEKQESPEVNAAEPLEESSVGDFAEPQDQSFVASTVPVTSESIRVSTSKLDTLLLQAEEMIAVKLATGERAIELRDLKKAFDVWKKETQRQGAIVISRSHHESNTLLSDPFISSFETKVTAMARAAEYDHRTSSAMVDKLLDDIKKTLMLPFLSMLEIFPRFVRDLARAEGKKVELTTEGGEIEVDRRVLEEMKDPLMHLVRNCIDHGIEMPEEREKIGKLPCGKIKMVVSSRDGKIEIVVSDDGAGIDVAKIKSSAVSHAMISQDAANKLGEGEALLLVFHSGVTTSPMITDLSGRGLGLAIVREKIEKLNGTVTVDTRKDTGTTFRMVVPVTLATFRGNLVRVSDQLFVLPSTNVERVARAKKEAIQTVENRETLVFDGQPVSLIRLADALELKTAGNRQQTADAYVQVVVLRSAETRVAFMVDEVLHEQEVLVKPLGRQLSRVKNIAGATVLGNGRVVPILNVADLISSAIKVSVAPSLSVAAEETVPGIKRILVAEDSITARTLLKNILESAGYFVQTAVDGIDAITALKGLEFDIVVSDVEMPRMNGFDLTSRIRSDKKLSELPVVLVTALESREDRERGIDAGANAYIVKSSFDQSNLIEVIKRLI